MVEQIYKSKNITVSVDHDTNDRDPSIIEEHIDDKKVILDELIAELQKPYSFKLGWSMSIVMIFNIVVTIWAIQYEVIDWVNLLNWIIFGICIYAGNEYQKAKHKSKALVLMVAILKVDGQI